MTPNSDKPEKKSEKAALKAAAELRKAEIRLADKMERAEAKAARKLRKAEGKWLKAAIKEAEKQRREHPGERITEIDLPAETHEEKALRQKKRVKRALVMASCGACVLLLWMLKLQSATNLSLAECSRLQHRRTEINARYVLASDILTRSQAIEDKLAALDTLTTHRFRWAPVLAALENNRLDDIKLIRVSGEQSLTQESPRIVGSGSGAAVVPGAMVERVKLCLEAGDLSSNGLSYIKYKKKLNACDNFVEDRNRSATFCLEGLQEPSVAGKAVPGGRGVMFVLSARFPDQRHD